MIVPKKRNTGVRKRIIPTQPSIKYQEIAAELTKPCLSFGRVAREACGSFGRPASCQAWWKESLSNRQPAQNSNIERRYPDRHSNQDFKRSVVPKNFHKTELSSIP